MELDHFSFLEPWTLMLPDRGSAVLLAVGSGGKTTLLRRLHAHFREAQRSVAWCALGPHPVPVGIPAAADAAEAKRVLREAGSVFLGAEIDPEDLESLHAELKPEILLVEGAARAEGRFEPQPNASAWPRIVHQIFCVAPLHAVGKPWSHRHVVGAPDEAERAGGEVRRVRTEDILESVREIGRQAPPARALVVPFLTGFGEYRDMDGMFELVGELCGLPGAKAVCLAELLGNERRDAADRRGLPEESAATQVLAGERVYAVYPSELDD